MVVVMVVVVLLKGDGRKFSIFCFLKQKVWSSKTLDKMLPIWLDFKYTVIRAKVILTFFSFLTAFAVGYFDFHALQTR